MAVQAIVAMYSDIGTVPGKVLVLSKKVLVGGRKVLVMFNIQHSKVLVECSVLARYWYGSRNIQTTRRELSPGEQGCNKFPPPSHLLGLSHLSI